MPLILNTNGVPFDPGAILKLEEAVEGLREPPLPGFRRVFSKPLTKRVSQFSAVDTVTSQ
jgi:hypothetical protein